MQFSILQSIDGGKVFSQRIWYNRLIKVNNKTIFNRNLSNKGVHNVRDLFNGNGTLKTWYKFKSDFNCREEMYFTFRQIIGALPKTMRKIINEDVGNMVDNGIYGQHFLRVTRQLTLDKMTSKEFYNIMIAKTFKL